MALATAETAKRSTKKTSALDHLTALCSRVATSGVEYLESYNDVATLELVNADIPDVLALESNSLIEQLSSDCEESLILSIF